MVCRVFLVACAGDPTVADSLVFGDVCGTSIERHGIDTIGLMMQARFCVTAGLVVGILYPGFDDIMHLLVVASDFLG